VLLSNAAIIAADIFTIDDAWRERSGGNESTGAIERSMALSAGLPQLLCVAPR
jgi:hypothetical protein